MFGRHQPHIVTMSVEDPADVVGPAAGLPIATTQGARAHGRTSVTAHDRWYYMLATSFRLGMPIQRADAWPSFCLAPRAASIIFREIASC